MPSILIIDDEKVIRDLLRLRFAGGEWSRAEAASGREGIALADRISPDVILLDMKLPDLDGLSVLRELRSRGCQSSIIAMTGWASIGNAVEAVKLGADQYLAKPLDLKELSSVIDRILETRKLRIENSYYRDLQDRPLVGDSPAMQKLERLIDLMAENSDTTVLLLGESGTGKGLFAREIHRRSRRRERPFLDINCAVLSQTLLESELFGHERGAFTDARELKHGLLEVADGGTVLLDEVAEMPAGVQPKLLRVLEARSFRRVGGTVDIPVNVRIIAASNRSLEQAVSAGRFREDLYYRVQGFPIPIPPLRDRPEDIPLLAGHFLSLFNTKLGKTVPGFTAAALQQMTGYGWPGNVRELKNLVERAIVLSAGGAIGAELLPFSAGTGGQALTLSEVERRHILKVLAEEGNNRSSAARVLGISRSTLLEKLKKYGIPRMDY